MQRAGRKLLHGFQLDSGLNRSSRRAAVSCASSARKGAIVQVFVPTQTAADWKRLLAKETHWKTGCSTMALGRCWKESKPLDGPPEIRRILGMQILLAMPVTRVVVQPARTHAVPASASHLRYAAGA